VPGHRRCSVGDDQGELAGLHHQARCSDVAATIPKLVDDHFGYRGTPAYLTCPSGQQDGVDVEQARDEGCVTEQAGVFEHRFQLFRTGSASGHDRI
jgi:hypothetical protein